MEYETVYRRIRIQFEDVLMYKNNSYVTKSTRVCYKHGNVDYYVERLKFEVTKGTANYLFVKFDSKKNALRIDVKSRGLFRTVEFKNEREAYDICLKIIEYSKYEPAEFIEMLYRRASRRSEEEELENYLEIREKLKNDLENVESADEFVSVWNNYAMQFDELTVKKGD